MAKTLQFRRDTTTNLASVTGAVGEIFIDTTKNTVVVMDGTTAGGHPLALEGAGGGSYGNADVATYLSNVNSITIGNTTMYGDGYGQPKLILNASNLTSTLYASNAVILSSLQGNVYVAQGNITTPGIKTDNYYYADGSPVSFGGGSGADLSQVSEDILPLFSEVYDLGSTTKRWYDAYLSNTLNINDVTLTGSAGTLTTAADVVVGSLLADQILITQNMIVPDASTAVEYSGGQGVVIVDGNMDIQGAWIKVPVVGTVPGEAAPSTTGAAGYIRYNTDTGGFEGYNGTAWGAIGGGGSTYTAGDGIDITDDVISATAPPLTYSTLTATGDGTTTGFLIGSGRTVNDVLVFVNGLCFTPTDDYTISGSTLTFIEAPSNLAEITIRFLPI